jgi:hypothetical protein
MKVVLIPKIFSSISPKLYDLYWYAFYSQLLEKRDREVSVTGVVAAKKPIIKLTLYVPNSFSVIYSPC